MSEHERSNHNPGYGGDGPEVVGPGYAWPGYGYGYGPAPGMGPWGGYPPQGPMGPPPGYGMGPPPGYGMGTPAGYGPMPEGGCEHGGADHGGHGAGAGMNQMFEELSKGSGLGGLGKLLDFEDTEFWKGALVGAAAVLLLTNESVQQSLFKSGVKARDAVDKGLGSLRRGTSGGEQDAPEEKEPAPGSTRKTRATKTRPKDKQEPS